MMNKKTKRSLEFPKQLLCWLRMYQQNYFILGDFEETFYEISQDRGYIMAYLWFWYQTLCFLPSIIAWPVSYFLMNRWLQNFAYRINLNFRIFILSGLTSLMIALLTVSFRTIKTILANPVESLRYE